MSKAKQNILLTIKYLFLSLISFISIFPFIWMILGMTNKTIDISSGKIMIGNQFMINFQNLLNSDLNFGRAMLNSAIIATILALLVSSMAGYGFEIYRSKWRDRVFNFILLSMMVPFSAIMIPLFRIFQKLNGTPFGINSLFVIIIPSVSTAFLIFLFIIFSKLKA